MRFRMVLLALTVGALGACVDNDRSLTITHFVEATASMGACTVPTDDMTTISQGAWDVELAKLFGLGYVLSFNVENQLQVQTGTTIDEQAYYINSYDVQLEPIGAVATGLPAGNRNFNVPSGSIRLAPGDIAGASVLALPPDLIGGLDSLTQDPLGTILVHLRPVATRAEEQVVGAYVQFPIEICKGCLTNATTGNFPSCPLPAMSTVNPGNACNPSADLSVTCCNDAKLGLVCPATVSMTTTGP